MKWFNCAPWAPRSCGHTCSCSSRWSFCTDDLMMFKVYCIYMYIYTSSWVCICLSMFLNFWSPCNHGSPYCIFELQHLYIQDRKKTGWPLRIFPANLILILWALWFKLHKKGSYCSDFHGCQSSHWVLLGTSKCKNICFETTCILDNFFATSLRRHWNA